MKMMPGKVAQIEWQDDDDGRLVEAIVFDRTVATEKEMARNETRFQASHGACVKDWMEGTRARSTPEGIFILWARDGFVDEMAMLEALDQLGQIEEAAFARTMAQAMRELLLQEQGGEDADGQLAPPVYS